MHYHSKQSFEKKRSQAPAWERGDGEFLMTNDERMTNVRSPKNLPLSEFLRKDFSSFDIGEFFKHSDFDICHEPDTPVNRRSAVVLMTAFAEVLQK